MNGEVKGGKRPHTRMNWSQKMRLGKKDEENFIKRKKGKIERVKKKGK